MCDVDTRGTGSVSFREETGNSDLLRRASADVVAHFQDVGAFSASSLFIATWDRVGYFRAGTDRVNTFQVVLVSDGDNSFAFFHYASNELRWFRGDGKSIVAGEADAPAQAGFNSGPGRGPGRLFTLPGSGFPEAVELEKKSNIGSPGRWLFHLSYRGTEVRGVAGNSPVEEASKQADGACADAAGICHNNARCVDYHPGFCCECVAPFYGNGRHCVEKGVAQRVNGKVTGNVNGVKIENVDLHSYVVTKDGRAYTAISRIDESIGYHLQTLSTLGGVIGWLFSATSDGVENGFMRTGGAFNRTATVLFLPDYSTVRIHQRFYGSDVYNQLRMDTEITGNIPNHFTSREMFSVDDYHETYRQLAVGKLHSTSTRTYRVGQAAYKYIWNQTIEFEECGKGSTAEERKQQQLLSVTRNFVIYDSREKIVRFAMTSNIAPHSGDGFDACKENKCSALSTCIPEGDSYRCACQEGYEGDGTYCHDMNECTNNIANCHQFADCINTEGSYLCQCKEGYRGHGRVSCTASQSCQELDCDPIKGRCVYDREMGQQACECLPGFIGDGRRGNCRKDDTDTGGGGGGGAKQTCADLRCDINAYCQYNVNQEPFCTCRAGYQGDGYRCQEDRTEARGCDVTRCGHNARCIEDSQGQGTCRCNEGYTGDGITCRADTTEQTCSTLRCPEGTRCNYNSEGRVFCEATQGTCQELDCDGNARCVIEKIPGQEAALPRCICNDGFSGDGIRCRRERRTCVEMRCDANANCKEYTDEPRCECNLGFIGNGIVCRQTTCQDLICDINAICYVDEAGMPSCRCKEGFTGNGQTCVASSSDCSVVSNCDVNAQCLFDPVVDKFGCQCNYGFEGNGMTCTKVTSRFTCDVANNCHVNAACVLDETRNYQCRCNPGYHGDGYVCNLRSCHEADICHAQAQCVLDITAGSYACRCNDGYMGDGHKCQPRRESSCRDLNNCHPQANCIYDPAASAYSCQCAPGFQGNGETSCLPIQQSCRENPALCDQNADCLQIPSSDLGPTVAAVEEFVCRCRLGFEGDGHTCSEMVTPDDTQGYLVYAHGMSLMKIPTWKREGEEGKQLLIKPGQTAIGLDVDCHERFIYWSDVSGKSILKADYDGGNMKAIITTGLGSPEGLAVDWIARNIYWTDSQLDRVEVARLDGSERRIIVGEDLVNPRGIVADPGNGRIFWADWNRNAPKIEVADMDGGNRRIFLDTDLGLPNGLTILYESNLLCIADAKFERVDCVDTNDAANRRTIYSEAAYPFDITNAGTHLFWSDWEERVIQGVDFNGNKLDTLDLPLGGNGRLYGIVFMRNRCPRGQNACARDNGGCPHFCFARQDKSKVCGCPDGLADCRDN